MCSCPPFECACPKSGMQEQQQQHYHHHHQHLYANLPPSYLDNPQGAQLPCGNARAGMPAPDQGFSSAPLALHPPPSFTQINITNTCLPPTASLDLNIPSVEMVKGCYSSNAQLHIPDQHHYKSFQNYSFQQHKIQFDYPHSHYHQDDHSQQGPQISSKVHKHHRESCIKSETKRRKIDDASAVDVKTTGQFSCKVTSTEEKLDSIVGQETHFSSGVTHQQDFQNVRIDNCGDYRAPNDLIYSGFPNAQISCDLNKTVVTQSYMARENSLLKMNKAASIMGDGSGQGDRLHGKLHASDMEPRSNGQIYSEPHYDTNTPVTDSSFLYDTISTVFGADQRPTSEQCSRNVVSPADNLRGEDSQSKHPNENSQSPPQIYNFLETYAASSQNQGSSPPTYTELISPQRQTVSHHENCSGSGKGSLSSSERQFYPCSLDGNANTHMQHQLLQQQYHPPQNHHQNQQPQHRQVQDSPSKNTTIDSFSPSLSHQNLNVSGEDQYNFYNLADANSHHCHALPLNHVSYPATTLHSQYNEYPTFPLNGDATSSHPRTAVAESMHCNYPCNETMYSTSAASQQAYRNRSINITLTYN